MDSWITSLKDLLDLRKLAKVSVPGLCVTVILVLIFWPPNPVDVVPIVHSGLLGISPPPATELGKAVHDGAGPVLQPIKLDPGCSVTEHYLAELPAPYQYASKEYKQSALARQYLLEEQNRYLDLCLAREKQLAGQEQSGIAALRHDLQALDASRAAQATLVADYEHTGSPLLPSAHSRLQATDNSIVVNQSQVRSLEQSTRDREWEVAELTRWKGVVAEDLNEPGKLRPVQGLDGYLQALSGHLLAFLTLSITIGIFVDSVSTPLLLRAFYAFVFRR